MNRLRQGVRLVLAIGAGLVASMFVIAVATWVATLLMFEGDMTAPPTTPYLVLNMIYTLGAGAAGGAIASRIGRGRPLPALLLAGLVLVLLIGGGGSPSGPDIPGWYTALMPLAWAAGALLGGWVIAGRGDAHPPAAGSRFIVLALLCSALPATVAGQIIVGCVTEEGTGQPSPAATVTLADAAYETERRTASGADGSAARGILAVLRDDRWSRGRAPVHADGRGPAWRTGSAAGAAARVLQVVS